MGILTPEDQSFGMYGDPGMSSTYNVCPVLDRQCSQACDGPAFGGRLLVKVGLKDWACGDIAYA